MDEAVAVVAMAAALITAIVFMDASGSEASASYRVEAFVRDAAAAAAEELVEDSRPLPGQTPARWAEIERSFQEAALAAAAGVCDPVGGEWATIAVASDIGSTQRWPWKVVAKVECTPATSVFGKRGPIVAVEAETVRWGAS